MLFIGVSVIAPEVVMFVVTPVTLGLAVPNHWKVEGTFAAKTLDTEVPVQISKEFGLNITISGIKFTTNDMGSLKHPLEVEVAIAVYVICCGLKLELFSVLSIKFVFCKVVDAPETFGFVDAIHSTVEGKLVLRNCETVPSLQMV